MKTSLLALALTLLSLPKAFACSPALNAEIRLKNDFIAEALNDYRLNATIDNLVSIELKNYTGGFFYTFPDRGADCPDSVRLSGEISTSFQRAIRYNQEKSEAVYERVSKNEISYEQAAEILKAVETCSVKAQVVTTKIPRKRGGPSYYRTELSVIEALSCAQ